ncbi:creatininase family protein [Saliphagus infecundisoli]|uniref:Creatininase family protein n=1 Tax=Saliphagus infecundisoli TaxID=1849069 RepID=A0ABD5QBS7_9EURY|nr:creatininase family protein [Saliphagus infecundisoli]
MYLPEATWSEVADCGTDLAVVPVGATEQHGPHAPLGTDFLIAEAVAAEGSERFSGEVVRAPTIPVGVSEEHRQFPGTLWLSPDTFREVVRETVAGLAAHGFDRVVLVNGHGGNVSALREVAGTITRHDAAYAVSFTWFDAVGDDEIEMGHAGAFETAVLRYLGDLVREGSVEEASDAGAKRWGEWVSGTNLAHDSAEFTDNGVVGDPAEGTEERGARLFDRATDRLADLLEAVERRDVSRPARRE